jgi:hypothetical protein
VLVEEEYERHRPSLLYTSQPTARKHLHPRVVGAWYPIFPYLSVQLVVVTGGYWVGNLGGGCRNAGPDHVNSQEAIKLLDEVDMHAGIALPDFLFEGRVVILESDGLYETC